MNRFSVASLTKQKGNAILELTITLPFMLFVAQGIFYVTSLVLDAQRASLLSREAGSLAWQDCAAPSDATTISACLANLQSQLLVVARDKLKLSGAMQTAPVIVPLTYPNPNNVNQLLTSRLTPTTARTRGIHYLVVTCATFACLDQAANDCDQSDASCTCSCGETPGNPNLPALGLQFADPEDPQWQGPGTDAAGRLTRIRIWQALGDILRRKGRAIIATTQREYLNHPPLVNSNGTINESAAF